METITVNEAAERCGVTPRTVRSWLTNKKITRYAGMNGYSVLISVTELDAFNTARIKGPLVPDGEAAPAYVVPGQPMPEYEELGPVELPEGILNPEFVEPEPVPLEVVRCIHGRELADCPRCAPK
jgi:excisionase family DNA binding protein